MEMKIPRRTCWEARLSRSPGAGARADIPPVRIELPRYRDLAGDRMHGESRSRVPICRCDEELFADRTSIGSMWSSPGGSTASRRHENSMSSVGTSLKGSQPCRLENERLSLGDGTPYIVIDVGKGYSWAVKSPTRRENLAADPGTRATSLPDEAWIPILSRFATLGYDTSKSIRGSAARGAGTSRRPDVGVGLSGWTYPGGAAFSTRPTSCSAASWNTRAASFSSIEVNGTHYALQKPETFQKWKNETPESFVFSIKGSRYITHIRRLKDAETAREFLPPGILVAKGEAGAISFGNCLQFPFRSRAGGGLPGAAASLTTKVRPSDPARGERRRDDREPERNAPCATAWRSGTTASSCRNFHPVAQTQLSHLSLPIPPGKWPYAEDLTSDFVYIRLPRRQSSMKAAMAGGLGVGRRESSAGPKADSPGMPSS